MSTTPRTDAECIQIYSDDVTGCSDARDYVDASFARELETELAAAQQEAAHYMSVAQKATDELARLRAENLTAHQMACAAGLERDQLRAEVKRWQAEAEEMSAQRSHNANQAGRLRAELVVEKNWVEHHSQHADDLIGENVKLRAEVERLTKQIKDDNRSYGCELRDPNGTIWEQAAKDHARAERAEAELKASRYETVKAAQEGLRECIRAERAEADTARLDWLAVSDAWFDYPATGAFTPDTMRAAIDAAMKGTP